MLLTGVLYNACGPLASVRIAFSATRTTQNGVLLGADCEFTTQADGTYSINLQPGYYTVYWVERGHRVRLGHIEADASSETTLPAALSADPQPLEPDAIDAIFDAVSSVDTAANNAITSLIPAEVQRAADYVETVLEPDTADALDMSVAKSAMRAEFQADRAETARDAAFVNADVYDDVAAGLADTVDGEQFQVVEGDEVVRYRNDAGAATELASYPAAAFVNLIDGKQLQDGKWRVRQYDSALTFVGFVDTVTTPPAHSKHQAYISVSSGTVLGIAASEGDLIVDDGASFNVVDDRAKTVYPLSDPSYNKLNPNRIVPDHYLSTTTGQPIKSVSAARWMTDFMFVEGVTFIASNTFAGGPMLAYDVNKDFISVVPNRTNGVFGHYTLPAGTVYIRAHGKNPDSIYMYMDDVSRLGTLHAYGVTEDSLDLAETDAEVATKARIDYVKTLNIVDGVNVLNPDDFTPGFTINSNGDPMSSATSSISPFLYCKGKSYASTNMFLYGGIYVYDENYNLISNVPRNTDTGFFDIPATAYYLRGVFRTDNNGEQYLYWDAPITEFYPFLQDRYNYKYKGLKLATIGDSITFQKSWQPRLVELTGMVWSEDETRGGVGYVEIDPTTFDDLGNYVADDAAIVDNGSTFVNNYGATLTLFEKGSQRYRAAYSMAEGGDTVMPRPGTTRSIYSRCGDAQYYEPDIIIIHGGANDRGYCLSLPTIKPNGRLSDITGITNLESDDPDVIADYEIHTAEANYTNVGDYTAEGDTTGRIKYSGTFRAAYRGMLKKIIEGNPAAIIFLIQPPRTFLYGDVYQNKVSEYEADEMNRVIADVGDEFGCQVIDTSRIFGTYNASQWFTADGQYIHPNSEGGKKIAEYIASQII